MSQDSRFARDFAKEIYQVFAIAQQEWGNKDFRDTLPEKIQPIFARITATMSGKEPEADDPFAEDAAKAFTEGLAEMQQENPDKDALSRQFVAELMEYAFKTVYDTVMGATGDAEQNGDKRTPQ